MIATFRKILVLAAIVSLLCSGFVLYTHQVMQRTTQPHIHSNLSQLPAADLGFLYMDEADTHDLSNLSNKCRILLEQGYLQELYIAYNAAGEASAKKINAVLEEENLQVYTLHSATTLIEAVYNVCLEQHNCTMTMIGHPRSVEQALFVALQLKQAVSGYVMPHLADQSHTVSDMLTEVGVYFKVHRLAEGTTALVSR